MSSWASVPLSSAGRLIDEFCERYRSCTLQVSNRGVFGQDQWLDIGKVDSPPTDIVDTFGLDGESRRSGPSFGHYLVKVLEERKLRDAFFAAAGIEDGDPEWKTASEVFQDAFRRALLLPIVFDDQSVSRLIRERPCSVVLDTSSLRQGAASFFIRNCQPFARLKIPPILSMELENSAQQFLSLDRKGSLKPRLKMKLLEAQATSQGAFRLLQRAQQDGQIIFEPILHAGDPLRSIFQPNTDREFQAFNFSEVNRGFADRLILENARDHLRLFGSGYDVMMLTSDQGMTRLALAEGIDVIYFVARQVFAPFGRTLTGVQYSLLTGCTQYIGLEAVLWELATSFGAARLWVDETTNFCIQSHPLTAPWSPANARDDRLDVFIREGLQSSSVLDDGSPPQLTQMLESTEGVEVKRDPAGKAEILAETRPQKAVTRKGQDSKHSKPRREPHVGGAAFSVPKLVTLVASLERGPMDRTAAAAALGFQSEISLRDYLAFLRSVQAVASDERTIFLTDEGHDLYKSMYSHDYQRLYELFCGAPSFLSFMSYVLGLNGRDPDWLAKAPVRREARGNYRDLADLSTMLFNGGSAGYPTPSKPEGEAFIGLAAEVFRSISDQDGFADTITFLEGMASRGVHPTHVRDEIRILSNDRRLHVSYQGAIPRVDRHGPQVVALEINEGQPVAKRYILQEGNFLNDEHASLRLRMEEGSK